MKRRCRWLIVLWLLGTAGSAWAGDTAPLDLSAWQRLPVFSDGRRMPLDTFARTAAEAICGRENPTLWLPEDDADSAELAEARKLFPGGRPRKFTAAELLLSWLMEPKKWERVPFLAAEHKQLREELLRLPVGNAKGRLRYISPWQFEHSLELYRRWEELRATAAAAGEDFKLSGVDRKIKDLFDAYQRYREVTFAPKQPGGASPRFFHRLGEASKTWQALGTALQRTFGQRDAGAANRLLDETAATFQKLVEVAHQREFSLEQIEPAVVACREAAVKLERELAADETPSLHSLSTVLVRHTVAMHFALYDNGDPLRREGEPLRLVPALDAGALEANRLPGDDAQPWLSVQALRYGSAALLGGYPPRELAEGRRSFDQVAAAYADRDNPQRSEQFAAAMEGFAAAIRALGEAVNPLRAKLPIQHKDDELLAATAYPSPDSTRVEVLYNQLDPFLWSWVISFGAMVCLSLSFGLIRKPMFWLGLVVLVGAQSLTVTGFVLRTIITGLVPMTGMFETVVFAALCVALFGLWFTLLPLVWPGLKAAWRLTALPLRPRATTTSLSPGGKEARGEGALSAEPAWWRTGNWLMLLPRGGLTYLVFIQLAKTSEQSGGYFSLLPKTALGSSLPTASNLMV